MIPPDAVMLAGRRWLELLGRSTYPVALTIVRSSAEYADLSATQYDAGLDWLRDIGLVVDSHGHRRLAPHVTNCTEDERRALFFTAGIGASSPPWLRDADTLVAEPDELPHDAERLATLLGVRPDVAWTRVQQIRGRIDLEERGRVGAAGEAALVRLLENWWPGSTTHVSQSDDGFGYDVGLRLAETEWHLEVKTTPRQGRLVIHLSRHEYEVGLRDPYWMLVIVGLEGNTEVGALATVRFDQIKSRAPQDVRGDAHWELARYSFGSDALQPGLPFVQADVTAGETALLRYGSVDAPSRFAWLPSLGTEA